MRKQREPKAAKRDRHAARREAIVRHYGKSQNMAATGLAFGISRERVRQVLDMEKAREPETMGGAQ